MNRFVLYHWNEANYLYWTMKNQPRSCWWLVISFLYSNCTLFMNQFIHSVHFEYQKTFQWEFENDIQLDINWSLNEFSPDGWPTVKKAHFYVMIIGDFSHLNTLIVQITPQFFGIQKLNLFNNWAINFTKCRLVGYCLMKFDHLSVVMWNMKWVENIFKNVSLRNVFQRDFPMKIESTTPILFKCHWQHIRIENAINFLYALVHF